MLADHQHRATEQSSPTAALSHIAENILPHVERVASDSLRWRTRIHNSSPRDLADLVECISSDMEKIVTELRKANNLWKDHGNGHQSQVYFCSQSVALANCAEVIHGLTKQLLSGDNAQRKYAKEGIELTENQKALLSGHIDEFSNIAHAWCQGKREEVLRNAPPQDPYDWPFSS